MIRKKTFLSPMILAAAVLAASFAGGCSFRPANAPLSAAPSAEPTPGPTPVPTEAVRYTVEYRLGEDVLATEEVYAGNAPSMDVAVPGVRFLGWSWESGESADPSAVPVWSDTVYYAVTRPLLNENVPFLFPGETGLLRPADPFTRGDMARAVRALLPDTSETEDTLAVWEENGEEILPPEELRAFCDGLFPPDEVAAVWDELVPAETDLLTRGDAAVLLDRLLGKPAEETLPYYPDVRPDQPYAAALLRAAGPGTLTKEALMEQTKDGFLWFDGYLYFPDEDGYFHSGETLDGLTYDGNGRYTSGDPELDDHVASAIVSFAQPEATREEDLKALYLHVKNDFKYLPRNYYESGAEGWDMEEALTMFRTGKGNCYNFTGAFCYLARGLGYNARTWSGTMGIQNQPHSWTEITLDDQIYICDPEIELNYWLNGNYTDNFMMRKEASGGWNYQAAGRPGIG